MKKNIKSDLKKILLIYRDLETGGIQTLIIRMIKWLISNEYDVTLFLYNDGGDLIKEIENLDKVKIICNDKKLKLGKIYNLFVLKSKILRAQPYDLIYSFDPTSFFISYFFKAKIRLSGVYHPEAYNEKDIITEKLRQLDAGFSDKLVFMNTSVKNRTEEILQQKLSGHIFPLPVNFNKVDGVQGGRDSKRIVSIGRIVDFKTYNFYMIDIIEKLIPVYPDVTYHIYGFGEQEKELLERIKKSPVKEKIFFHGELEYSKINAALKDSLCFVGMGTALIEACAYGIPGIAAVINDCEAKTYGYWHELPGYMCGEVMAEAPDYKVIDLIERLLQMKESEYELICEKSKLKSSKFEVNSIMEKFIEDKESVFQKKAGCLSLINFLSTMIKKKQKN